MSKTKEIEYGRHLIRAMPAAAGYRARAFRGDRPVGVTLAGATLDAAVLAVTGFLDEQAAALHARRGPTGFPCTDEVRAALSQVRKNKAQDAMLTAHLNAPDNILTATELAEAAGYKNYAVVNRQYGQLAHDLAHELDWTPEEQEKGETVWTFTLAEGADKRGRGDSVEVTGHWRWKLRPEIVEALS